jgi:hypothetical protein
MTKSPKVKKSQIDKFRETARELECDNDEDRFGQVLKRVAQAPVPKSDKPTPAKRGR